MVCWKTVVSTRNSKLERSPCFAGMAVCEMVAILPLVFYRQAYILSNIISSTSPAYNSILGDYARREG